MEGVKLGCKLVGGCDKVLHRAVDEAIKPVQGILNPAEAPAEAPAKAPADAPVEAPVA